MDKKFRKNLRRPLKKELNKLRNLGSLYDIMINKSLKEISSTTIKFIIGLKTANQKKKNLYFKFNFYFLLYGEKFEIPRRKPNIRHSWQTP